MRIILIYYVSSYSPEMYSIYIPLLGIIIPFFGIIFPLFWLFFLMYGASIIYIHTHTAPLPPYAAAGTHASEHAHEHARVPTRAVHAPLHDAHTHVNTTCCTAVSTTVRRKGMLHCDGEARARDARREETDRSWPESYRLSANVPRCEKCLLAALQNRRLGGVNHDTERCDEPDLPTVR